MRLLFTVIFLVLFSTISFPAFSSTDNTYPGSPDAKGHLKIGGTFLYLEPTATDGDFEYGTVVGPVFSARQVTNAHLQSLQPNFRSAFNF